MRHLLTEYSNSKVEVFANYIDSLRKDFSTNKNGVMINEWARNANDESFAKLFKNEAEKGMFIDGESINLIEVNANGVIFSISGLEALFSVDVEFRESFANSLQALNDNTLFIEHRLHQVNKGE